MPSAQSAAAIENWDRLARRYGRQEQLELHAIDAALRCAAPGGHEHLVDLATGTGLLLRRLALDPARPRSVIGVDHSSTMLAAVGSLPTGWSTLPADARAVPRPDGWADVVTCAYLLHLLGPRERAAVLLEARRLLGCRSASRLVVVTVWADRRRVGGRLAHDALRLLARSRPAAWGGLLPLDPSDDLRHAGFDVTRRLVLPRHGYPSLVLAARPSFRIS